MKSGSSAVRSNCTGAKVAAHPEVGWAVPMNQGTGKSHKKRERVIPFATLMCFDTRIFARPAPANRQIIPCKFQGNFIRVNDKAV
jgi:hypothetical protein